MCRSTNRRVRCARHSDRDENTSQRRHIVIKTPLSILIQHIIDSRAQKRAALHQPSVTIHEPIVKAAPYTHPKPQVVQRVETMQEFLGRTEAMDEKEQVWREEKRRESVAATAVLPRYSQVLRE